MISFSSLFLSWTKIRKRRGTKAWLDLFSFSSPSCVGVISTPAARADRVDLSSRLNEIRSLLTFNREAYTLVEAVGCPRNVTVIRTISCGSVGCCATVTYTSRSDVKNKINPLFSRCVAVFTRIS